MRPVDRRAREDRARLEREETRKLIERLQADLGDEAAFARLFALHHGRIYRLFTRQGFLPADCEDLTQNTFHSIYRGISTFRRDARFETWSTSVATNAFREHLRKAGAEMREGQELSLSEVDETGRPKVQLPPDSSAGPDETTLQRESRALLRKAVENLPEQMRLCLKLRLYQGLKYREIASLMGLSEGTVKAHLNEAKTRVSQEMRQELAAGNREEESDNAQP